MLERLEAVEIRTPPRPRGTLLLRKCLTGKLGEDFAGGAVLPSGAFLHREQHVIVDRQCGAHTSDVTALDVSDSAVRGGLAMATAGRRCKSRKRCDQGFLRLLAAPAAPRVPVLVSGRLHIETMRGCLRIRGRRKQKEEAVTRKPAVIAEMVDVLPTDRPRPRSLPAFLFSASAAPPGR